MPRRVTPAQFRSMVQQAQRRQKQAIDKYNREVRRHNHAVKQEVAKVNREITAHNQKVQREVNKYNSEVRAHNARVRANRSRLLSGLRRLESQANSNSYITQQTSVRAVARAYRAVESREALGHFREEHDDILEYAEREAANSVGVINALLEDKADETAGDLEMDESVSAYLASISSELVDRWKGALFSLNPNNPDAARHFCTSAREVITCILDVHAPNDVVLTSGAEVKLTPNGTPTRREKIAFMLRRRGLSEESMTEFVLADVNDVIDLFKAFNDGTHGSAGKFSLLQLSALKKRVEDAFGFLSKLTR